jgi:hypothetical protein
VTVELAMSPARLQRLPQKHGTSFRERLDDVLHEHAQGYLTATSFSDSEMAFPLRFQRLIWSAFWIPGVVSGEPDDPAVSPSLDPQSTGANSQVLLERLLQRLGAV